MKPVALVSGILALAFTITLPSREIAAQNGGWGTVRGQVLFAGDKIPDRPPLKVDKDQEHCLQKGPLLSEKWTVNPANKGVRWVVAYLVSDPANRLPIHPDLKEPSPKEVVLDQPCCNFDPHVIALREGQTLVARNPAPVAHSVNITGFKNSFNIQMAPGTSHKFTSLAPERNAVKLSCGQHPWMEGYAWIFDHPYFAVTDADGKFEIKQAPAGTRHIVIWHEDVGYVGSDRKGKPVEIKPGGVTDLGKVEIKPRARS